MNNKFIIQQKQINFIKKYFSNLIEKELNLLKVESPLLIRFGEGIQDDLSGKEESVKVKIKAMPNDMFEIIHSLAKWKRKTLAKFCFSPGNGIYANMKGLRTDENNLTSTNSVLVDQWDWEKVIFTHQRTLKYLKHTVVKIYNIIKKLEKIVTLKFGLNPILPKTIKFIHSEELLQLYPNIEPKAREHKITKKFGAIFLIGIGKKLSNGMPHDIRAPDYDDWITLNDDGYFGLNGDIIIWNPILQSALEISSMGIRVNKNSLINQLTMTKNKKNLSFTWHQDLINNLLPQTIGGGIGQSRLIMLILQKKHIGQVQSSVWPSNFINKNINFL